MEAARSFRIALKLTTQVKSKDNKSQKQPQPKAKNGIIWIAKVFPPWQSCVLDTMRELYEQHNGLPDNKIVSSVLNTKSILKKYMKRVMPFAQMIRERVENIGKDAMAVTVEFDERKILVDNLNYIKHTLNVIITFLFSHNIY